VTGTGTRTRRKVSHRFNPSGTYKASRPSSGVAKSVAKRLLLRPIIRSADQCPPPTQHTAYPESSTRPSPNRLKTMHKLIFKFVSCLRIHTTEVESVGLATRKTRRARRGRRSHSASLALGGLTIHGWSDVPGRCGTVRRMSIVAIPRLRGYT
jgi:hypothetical protein